MYSTPTIHHWLRWITTALKDLNLNENIWCKHLICKEKIFLFWIYNFYQIKRAADLNPLNGRIILNKLLNLRVHLQCTYFTCSHTTHIFRYVRKSNAAVTHWGLTLGFLTSAFSVAFCDKTSDSAQKCLAVMGALTLNAAFSRHWSSV